ncbi:helix-turn-helix domain-containing protein [Nocardiopsis sp. NPDC101807]|uniref:helix-turn-helix domain-containing protein n=1 Tax=Nocardiopsis sp. NPDC101807 TaxID=3364339 RepID=UPI00382660EF
MPPTSGSSASNVREARNALGKRLRELRRQADLSGKQLVESLSWPASKRSELENSHQLPE